MQSATIVLVTLVAVTGLTMFYMLRTRHIERMTRIEHGLEEINPNAFNNTLVNLGLFLSFLGLSLFVSYLLSKLTGLPDHVLIPGCLLLFGGGSLLMISFLDKRK